MQKVSNSAEGRIWIFRTAVRVWEWWRKEHGNGYDFPHQEIERRSFKRRLVSMVLETDTTGTRITLVIYAICVAIAFWSGGDKCELRTCEVLERMLADVGGWKAWGWLWTLYAVLGAWRVLDGVHRPRVALPLNFFGAILFGAMSYAALSARWPIILIAAPYIALAGAAIWIAMRTAINPGRGFRGD